MINLVAELVDLVLVFGESVAHLPNHFFSKLKILRDVGRLPVFIVETDPGIRALSAVVGGIVTLRILINKPNHIKRST